MDDASPSTEGSAARPRAMAFGRSVVAAIVATLPRGNAITPESWRRRHRAIFTLAWLHVPALYIVGVQRGYGLVHPLVEVALILSCSRWRRVQEPEPRREGVARDVGPRLVVRDARASHRWPHRDAFPFLRRRGGRRALSVVVPVPGRHRIRPPAPRRGRRDGQPLRVQPPRRAPQPMEVGGHARPVHRRRERRCPDGVEAERAEPRGGTTPRVRTSRARSPISPRPRR